MSWINSLLGHGGPQVKKFIYILTMLVGLACLVVDLYIERTLSATWVAALGVLTGFATTGYLGGKQIAKE